MATRSGACRNEPGNGKLSGDRRQVRTAKGAKQGPKPLNWAKFSTDVYRKNLTERVFLPILSLFVREAFTLSGRLQRVRVVELEGKYLRPGNK